MGWKDWPYSLKGGIIGAGIWILLFILDNIRMMFIDTYILSNIISFPGTQIYLKFIQPNLVNIEDLIIIVCSIAFYIIIGAALGFIVKLSHNKK